MLFLLLGVPLSLWISRSDSAACRALSFFVTLPLVFPPIALGYILLILLGKNGAVGIFLEHCFGIRVIFSQIGVLLAAFTAGLPLVVRPLSAALKNRNIIMLEEAARVNGCGALSAFFFVTLPLVRNSLASGLLLGLARASGEVGITMMLGGNISGRTNTLSLEIFNSVSRGDFETASSLCFLLAAFGLILYIMLEKLQRKGVS